MAQTSGRRVGIIARREFMTTVRRREFLLVTLGLPFLYLLIGFGVVAATANAAGEAAKREAAQTRVLGWLDQSGLLQRDALEKGDEETAGKLFPSEKEGQAAVRSGKVRAFILVPADFVKSGSVTLYLPEDRGSLFSEGTGGVSYLPVLRRAILSGKLPASLVPRVVTAPDVTRLQYDPKSGTFQPPNALKAVGRFAVPYVFSLLLVFSVLFSSSYLLHGIVEEKENRVIEVLLSAATHEELLLGKLIGLGGAGMVQLGLWLGTGGIGALFAVQFVRQLTGLTVSPALVLTGLIFFLLGFGFYAALMAGIGSFGTSWRESQQISGILAFLLVIPMMAMAAILESPDGVTARVLSFLPPTAPTAMMLRVAAGGSSVPEVIASALLLAASVFAVVRISARLFRLSLLLYGQRPTVTEVLRWLRYRSA